MKGQWIGKYFGDYTGEIVVNIDLRNGEFLGRAFLHPDDSKLPSTVVYFLFPEGGGDDIDASLLPIDPKLNSISTWDQVKKHFSDDIDHATSAKLSIVFIENNFQVIAVTDLGGKFNCNLVRSEDREKSIIISEELDWEDFKNHVFDKKGKNFIFRGQKENWSLRTTFHRLKRYRIDGFLSYDVSETHQRLSAITNHFFNLDDPKQNGAFFNLLQHHGYPTPLLDWSSSPFVAAFFAFKDIVKDNKNTGHVRIFIFDNEEWKSCFNQVFSLDPVYPHLSVTDFIALENPRMVPQQALTTVTNLVDLEAYILLREEEANKKFIYAIDIPIKDRDVALRELALMGITAGSMFPGIDGICEELKEKNF